MEHKHEDHPLIGYGTYIMVWLALLIMTGLTVTVAGLNLKNFSIVAAIFIAGFKSTLVLNYFMHLKYESALFKSMVFITIFTLVIIIGLTFTDISFR
ncbi:MAG: cytochrome C oxidase subunit IV family protein [Calditrichia bacterium]|nr:cytochrome C oxidase subunit IV family protein [Calditrichia bacterium]MCK5455049.1 cytochrome C oxidase subunit IV family protein [Calditrichia bacterium]